MIIKENEFAKLNLISKKKTLEFLWKDSHKNMSYQDFQNSCDLYGEVARENNIHTLLIDTRNFQIKLPENYNEWQDQVHFPELKKIGIKKMAFVVKKEVIDFCNSEFSEAGGFYKYFFTDREAAVQWLNEETELV